MDNTLPVDERGDDANADEIALVEKLEQADDLLAVMAATARWINQPDIYAWLMLPISERESEVHLVSQHPLPKENIRGLIDEFLWSLGSTATAYGATVPAPEVINIHQVALDEQGTWEPMNEPVFEDVGIATRGKLHAVLRACAAQQAGAQVGTTAQRVARLIAPYVDACLLARKTGRIRDEDSTCGLLSYAAFKDRIQQEVLRARQQPREMSLLRVKLVPRPGAIAAEELERAHVTVCGLLHNTVRGGDVVGRLDEDDIGVLMPGTGPRRALIAAMRLSDVLAESPAISKLLSHFVGVSGWAISGSDVEGLLLETELAAAQAQYASTGAVQLYM